MNSVFLDPGAFIPGIYTSKRDTTEKDVRTKIDALHQLGIQTIVITYPEYIHNTWGAFYSSDLPELNQFPNPLKFDLIATVMNQADKNKQHVMLGIGRGKDPMLTYDGCKNPARLEASKALSSKVIQELYNKFVKRHSSFSGWYITHECRDIQYASAYYDHVADLCHSLTPGNPVMIAPDGAPIADPEVISKSHVDIFAYQDAVGAGFVPPPNEKYSYHPDKRLPHLNQIFRRYAKWHKKNPEKQIWATVELWQMDGPDYSNAYPADWSRVKKQIDIIKPHVSQIIFYESGGFLESPLSETQLGGMKAVKLYKNLQEHLKNQKQKHD